MHGLSAVVEIGRVEQPEESSVSAYIQVISDQLVQQIIDSIDIKGRMFKGAYDRTITRFESEGLVSESAETRVTIQEIFLAISKLLYVIDNTPLHADELSYMDDKSKAKIGKIARDAASVAAVVLKTPIVSGMVKNAVNPKLKSFVAKMREKGIPLDDAIVGHILQQTMLKLEAHMQK